MVVLGVITPGYSVISDYRGTPGVGKAPYAIVQRANVIVFGVSILAFSFGLYRSSREGKRPWLVVILIGAFGAVSSAQGRFRTT